MTKENKIYIDGIDFTPDTIGIDDFELSVGLGESKIVSYSFSNTLTFCKEAFYYLEAKFFGAPDCAGQLAECEVVVHQASCGIDIEFVLTAELLNYTPDDCEITGQLQQKTDLTRCFDDLDNNVFWTRGFFDNRTVWKVQTCRHSDFFGWRGVVFSIVSNIISVLNVFFLGFLDDILDAFGVNVEGLLGCKGKMPSAKLKDILEYNLELCGGCLQSSILQEEPYNSVALMPALRDPCVECNNLDPHFPEITTIELLQLLTPVFNAECRLKDVNGKPTLIFEREDYFEKVGETLPELVDLETAEIEVLTYQWTTDNLFSYFQGNYAQDPLDKSGNFVRQIYNDTIEWNPSGSAAQKGSKRIDLQFSPLWVFGDWVPIITTGNVNGSEIQVDPFEFRGRASINDGASGFYKLAMVDCNSDPNCALIDPVQQLALTFTEGGAPNQLDPTLFDTEQEIIEVIGFEPEIIDNLYTNFWEICRPDNENAKRQKIESVTYCPEDFCRDAELILANGIDVGVVTRFGTGKPDDVRINFSDCTITLTNINIRGCFG